MDLEEVVRELYRKMGIGGAIEDNKSIPTEEYYSIHYSDYSKLQESYADTITSLLSD